MVNTWRLLRLIGVLMILTQLSGCISWHGKHGYKHTLFLGFGFISSKTTDSIIISKGRNIGISLRAGYGVNGVTMGYQSFQNTIIPPQWQGIFILSNGTLENLTKGTSTYSPLNVVTNMEGKNE